MSDKKKKSIIKKDDNEPLEGELVPIPFEDPELMQQFLDKPMEKISEAVTGLIKAGKKDAILAGAKVIQAAVKGKGMQQFGKEVHKLIEEGKIDKDYAKKNLGWKSLYEVLQFLDEDGSDIETLHAVKTLFFAVNLKGREVENQMKYYRLMKIVKELNAGQLMLLRQSYKLYKEIIKNNPDVSNINWRKHIPPGRAQWQEYLAKKVGHEIPQLIAQDEEVLMNKMLLDKLTPDGKIVLLSNARLTILGLELSKALEENELEQVLSDD